jgi:hypothetical protein
MNQKIFRKKYRGIKLYKYVPFLEKELKDTIRSKLFWIEAATDAQEKYESERSDKLVLFLQVSLICFLAFLLVMFNVFIIRRFF